MKQKRIFTALLCLCFLLALLPISALGAEIVASGTCGDNLTWTLDSAGTLTISGEGEMDDYEENYGQANGTFAPWSKNSSEIKKVIIEEGVTSIGNFSFSFCENLKSVVIPESLTKCVGEAFYGSTAISAVHIKSMAKWFNITYTSYLYGNPTSSNQAKLYLNGNVVEEMIIPQGVTKINSYAVSGGIGFRTVFIPDGVTTIGRQAFISCRDLESVVIPSSVNTIEDGVFYGCEKLKTVFYEGTEKEWNRVQILKMGELNEDFWDRSDIEIVFKHDHQYIDGESKVVLPTCSDAGYTKHLCEKGEIQVVAYTPALGHDIVTDLAVPATCEATGLTEGSHCSRCDYKIEQKVTPALGHDMVTDAAVPATCEATGLTEGSHCSRCDYKIEQKVTPALGHDMVTDAAVPATCEATGLTEGSHCSRCDYKIEQKVTPALGHDMVTDPAVPATCEATGLTEGSHCSRCDYKIEQKVTPALGHDMVTDPAVPATCEATGLTEGSHCSRCDYKIEQKVTPALGHDMVTDPAVPATCEATGLTEGSHCSRCDYKVEQKETPIDPNNHVGPSHYDHDGQHHWTVCDACGGKSSAEDEHSYGEDHVCVVCGYLRGFAVSGTVESFLDENGSVTLSLINGGEVKYTTSITGNTAHYCFDAVAPATYTLRVEKAGHVMRTYVITVTDTGVEQDAKICPYGDIDGDGETGMLDMIRLYNHINETEELTDYAYLCADVDGDGEVGMLDMIRLYGHINETAPLY